MRLHSPGKASDGAGGKKKSPWREGKGPKNGLKHKKPSAGEAQRNKSFFEARKAANDTWEERKEGRAIAKVKHALYETGRGATM